MFFISRYYKLHFIVFIFNNIIKFNKTDLLLNDNNIYELFSFNANPTKDDWDNEYCKIILNNKELNDNVYLVLYTDNDIIGTDWGYIDIKNNKNNKNINIYRENFNKLIKINGNETIEIIINSKLNIYGKHYTNDYY